MHRCRSKFRVAVATICRLICILLHESPKNNFVLVLHGAFVNAKAYLKYKPSTKRVGLKPISSANGTTRSMSAIGHKNTCSHVANCFDVTSIFCDPAAKAREEPPQNSSIEKCCRNSSDYRYSKCNPHYLLVGGL